MPRASPRTIRVAPLRLPRIAGGVGPLVVALVGAATLLLPGRAQGQEAEKTPVADEPRCAVQRVSTEDLEAAMRARRGYDPTATPNQGRFLAEVLLDLAREHRARDPAGAPILIRYEEFFPAFLRLTGLEAEEAPPGFRHANRVNQRIVVEYRRDRVVEAVEEGPDPRQVLAVRATWPDTGSAPASFSFRDTASDPEVRVRNERPVLYRLVEFDSVVAYDRMSGLVGRPVSGVLGVLFDVVGMVDIRAHRFAAAGDGTQVTLTRVERGSSMESVATVTPDGRASRGLPDGRPELERLRELVERDFEIEYAGEPPPACPGRATGPRPSGSPPERGRGGRRSQR